MVIWLRKLKQGLWINLEGWDKEGGGREFQKGGDICIPMTSLVAQMVKHLPTMRETRVQSLGREYLLEKEMATHSSILAWKIPWTEEPGRLQSMGSQRVGHDWATFFLFFLMADSCWGLTENNKILESNYPSIEYKLKTKNTSTFRKLRSWHLVPSVSGKYLGDTGNSDRLYFFGLQNHCIWCLQSWN